MKGILDTSTLIDLADLDAQDLPSEPLITAITLAELSVGPLVARSETERAARQAHLQQAEADFEPLPFDAASARAFGVVAASLRRAGRKPAAAYDALIAATAISSRLPLFLGRTTSPESRAWTSGECTRGRRAGRGRRAEDLTAAPVRGSSASPVPRSSALPRS